MPSQDNDDILSKIVQNLATAQTYLSKAVSLVAKYQDAVAPVPLGTARGTNTAIHSLQVWAEYLAEHGPTLRSDLDTATSLSLTKSGYDRTQAWASPMTYMADDALPGDAVMRIKGLSNGVGRPPVVYFLWSDRWSVLPKYGVGPTKPDNMPAVISIPTEGAMRGSVDLTGLTHDEATEALYGPAEDETMPSRRYATMAEWDEAWAPTFDGLVATETKPTDEVKQRMRDTLPDGAEANAAIAIAYRQATLRLREPQPMLGVVMPPDTAADGSDDLDWGDVSDGPPPDRSGWTMVGNHNHLPHAWSDFCDISQCQRLEGGPPPT